MFSEAQKALLKPGGIAVIPTDTVYGVVARAADTQAVERLYRLKKRDKKTGTVIAANIDQLVDLGVKRRYVTAVEQYWPGAVSVETPCSNPDLAHVHRGLMRFAIRIPDDPKLQALLEKTGPLVTSSANQPGETPAINIEEARAYFGDEVDVYVDGGDYSQKAPSTIIRIVDDAVEVIRQGAVTIES